MLIPLLPNYLEPLFILEFYGKIYPSYYQKLLLHYAFYI